MRAILLGVACSGGFPADTATVHPRPDEHDSERIDTGGGTDSRGTSARDIDSDVCINEFMPENDTALVSGDGSTPDWIELHSYAPVDIPMGGWSVSDDREEVGKNVLTDDLVLPAGGFLLLYADGDPSLGPDHLPFALSADGGDVALFEPDGDGQVIAYGVTEGDFSVARVPDCCAGADCIGFVFRGTPGATNGGG